MAESVGQIGLDLVVNQNNFKKGMSGVTGLAKKAGAALAGAFAVSKLVQFGKECLDLGSDLQEVQNVVDVTFPSMSARVDEFARSAAASFGLSETMAKKYTGTFGSMAKAFGFTEEEAYSMGTALTGLTGDVASFYNLSQDEAYTKLKSVFTGETESLKDLGIVMTQTALDSYALANGFGKTTSAMSEGEKVALRYKFVQEQLTGAAGDFTRTSGGWANQVRVLTLQFDSLKATIGQGLINLFTPIIKVVNTVVGKLATLANAFRSFSELITGNKSSGSTGGVGTVADDAAEASDGLGTAADSAGDLADSTEGVGTAAKKAAKDMKALMGFDQINKVSEPDAGTDTGSSEGSAGAASLGSAVDYGSLAQGETAVDRLDGKFSTMFAEIQKAAAPTTAALQNLWDNGLKKLGGFTWGTLKDFWSGFLVPMGTWMLGEDGLPRLFNVTNDLLTGIDWDTLKQSLGDFYASLQGPAQFRWTGLMDFYESFLVPLSTWAMSEGLPRLVDCFTKFNDGVDWEGLNGALDTLWKALEPLAENVGEGLLWFVENVLTPLGTWTMNEAVPHFLETLSTAIEVLNEVIEALKPTFQYFWDNVLSPIASWTGGIFLSVWDGINEALGAFAAWCRDNPGVIQAVAVAIGVFTAAILIWNAAVAIASTVAGAMGESFTVAKKVTTLGQAFSFLTSPIGLAIAALVALVAAGIVVYKNWDKIKAKATEIWGAIKKWFEDTCRKIGSFFTGLWKGISETFQKVGTWFREKFQAAKDAIVKVFQDIGLWFENRWNDIKRVFLGIGTWFGEKFQAAKDAVVKIFQGIGGWFGDRWDDIKKVFSGIGTWFDEKFGKAYDNVKKAFEGAGKFFGGVWDGIKGAFSNISGWFRDKFSAAWKAVKDVFSSGGEVFSGIKDGILDGLKVVINALIDGINEIVSVPFAGINGALDELRDLSIAGFEPFTWLPTIPTPQIPRLAQGGFVRKNTPQLAMIGDNRHQGEVVAPEGKLQEMVDMAVRSVRTGITREEMEAIMNNAVMRITAALSSVGFNLDGEQVATLQRMAQTNIDRRFNSVTMT